MKAKDKNKRWCQGHVAIMLQKLYYKKNTKLIKLKLAKF